MEIRTNRLAGGGRSLQSNQYLFGRSRRAAHSWRPGALIRKLPRSPVILSKIFVNCAPNFGGEHAEQRRAESHSGNSGGPSMARLRSVAHGGSLTERKKLCEPCVFKRSSLDSTVRQKLPGRPRKEKTSVEKGGKRSLARGYLA